MKEITFTDKLVQVVTFRQERRPVTWIARETGLDAKDVRAVLRIAGDSRWHVSEMPLDTYDQVEYLVSVDASLSEISRTTGVDYRTVKKYFPDAGWTRGGERAKMAGSMARTLKALERKDLL